MPYAMNAGIRIPYEVKGRAPLWSPHLAALHPGPIGAIWAIRTT
jgi:hypothetical protein